MINNESRIPVTLLTGFLGAGKTTLLNHLIRDPEAGRVAVIMNEFGAVGLDHDLIEASTEETILMQSGCLCCTFRGDISTTLESLKARRDSGELAFDRVIIETTGIAEPGPILHTLVVDEQIALHYRLDGVVTLADAATGPATLEAHAEAVNQIALADLVVVTKSDLVTQEALMAFEARLGEINASAQRVQAVQGAVPTGTLFGLSGMHAAVTPGEMSNWLGKVSSPSQAEPPGDTPKTRHDQRITSICVEVETPIPTNVFDFWLDTLIALKGPDILRMKGIVHLEDMNWPFVFHGVQHIFDTPVPLENWTRQDRTSRVVLIARDMSKEELSASLDILRMRPDEADVAGTGMIADTPAILS